MHRVRTEEARELDPSAPSPSSDGKRYSPCPTCTGLHGRACELCGGLGHVLGRTALAEVEEDAPAWFDAVAEFLRAWQLVERYGLDGAFRVLALGDDTAEFDPAFVEALELFAAEIERLDLAERREQAEQDRKRARDKR